MSKQDPVVQCDTVQVSTLGGFSLTANGQVLTDEINRSQKLWSVLSYLILHRDRAVPQPELIDLFWAEEGRANPNNALKTLLYRVRALLEPLFPQGPDPILSQRGSYIWNPALLCEVDTDLLESYCRQAEDPALSPEERVERYLQAADLYHGDFLPKLSGQLWVVPLSAHYHNMYITMVKTCASLLDGLHRYDEMQQLCAKAVTLDPLDESLHVLLVRALIRQGKDAAALDHYEKATDLLYRNLGVRPSEELRALYREIMDVEESLETDLEVIQTHLRETASRPGAFVCEYGFFKEAYRLEARRAARSGTCVHIGLVTVSQPDGKVPPLNVLNTTMDQLLDVMAGNLRRGDVVSRYSGAQYVVMLPAANFEDSTMVMERIVNAFYRQHRRNYLKLSYKIRALELN